ncbi:MAG: hypothetical protein J1E79_01180 [Rikenella sp.]|nr:hypothetical protein [Rikenella sp.]
MKRQSIVFDDKTVHELFGFEDAESESIERLKEYYLKKDTFDRVTTDLPVRILVGHKGTGKSALFKVAMSEEADKGNLPILIKPDDIAELATDAESVLLRIRQWKLGLNKIIGEKVFITFGIEDETVLSKLTNLGLKLSNYIYQTISNFNQHINLESTQKALLDKYLQKRKIVVYIDDLDRGWEGKQNDINRIAALLNAVRDLSSENDGLLFKISLRSDVYYLVRTADESTDKIEGSVVWCDWSNHEILVLLVKRILTFFGEKADYNNLLKTDQFYLSKYLDDIFERKFQGKGKWADTYTYKVLMSMIRRRPRDLVKLCVLAAQNARHDNSNIIKTENLEAVFESYSQGRIQDTINEFRSELPNIERLIFGMKPNRSQKEAGRGYVYTSSELITKLRNIQQNQQFTFKDKQRADPKRLIQFLFKINFLTARKRLENGVIQRKYFEESRYLISDFVDFGYDWEVHPAFRWALQPDDINDIFAQLFTFQD